MQKIVKRHAHALVVETAEQMAGAEYEEVMKNNDLYRNFKEQWLSDAGRALVPDLTESKLQTLWIKLRTPRLLEAARKSLAQCLTSPNLNEDQKKIISDALILDHSLKRGRIPRTKHAFRP